jgi:Zn-dependent protease with chaperone function
MLTHVTSRLLSWASPSRAARRQASKPEVQDVVSLSNGRPPRKDASVWVQLGLVAGLLLAIKFAGPLAYSLDPIRPDSSQVIASDVQTGSNCHPTGRLVRGTQSERERLERVGQTLQRYSHRPEVDYRYVITQMQQPNAESCASGLIGFDQEVVATLDEQELLFVGAHEQGHVEGRDHAKLESAQRQAVVRQFNPISWLPGYMDAVEDDLLGQARTYETEADCYALGVMKAEGVPPAKAASALQKVERLVERRLNVQTNGGGDHPETSQRIRHLLNGCQ